MSFILSNTYFKIHKHLYLLYLDLHQEILKLFMQ